MKALYREYRPVTFDEVYDQDNIVKVLKNQVKTGKVSHAYIFSGTRGTGKTSCAKIFSRAVNCLHPKDGNPCNECENCKSILNETTVDVVEMDAASNRRIDDIRDLREKAIYPPTKLKYKVYIIDEAHMITNEAFNALLKIMEEPPAHLILIFATTEIEKVPQTILSRAQRFEFKRISTNSIKKNLEKILKDLSIEKDDEALDMIAENSGGAMRDAVSLLDQSIINGEFKFEYVKNNIGGISFNQTERLVSKILSNDSSALLDIVNLDSDSLGITRDLINIFRNGMLIKGGLSGSDIEISKEKEENIKDLFKNVDMGRIVDSLEILIEYENLQKKSDNGDTLLELLIIRLINYVDKKSLESRVRSLESKLENVDGALSPKKNSFEKITRKEELKENIKRTDKEIIHKQGKENLVEENHVEKEKENLITSSSKKENEKVSEKIEVDKSYKKNEDLESLYYERVDEIISKSEDIGISYEQNMLNNSTLFFGDNRIYFLFREDAQLFFLIAQGKEDELDKIFKDVLGKNVNISIVNDRRLVQVEEKKDIDKETNKEKENISKLKDFFGEDNLNII